LARESLLQSGVMNGRLWGYHLMDSTPPCTRAKKRPLRLREGAGKGSSAEAARGVRITRPKRLWQGRSARLTMGLVLWAPTLQHVRPDTDLVAVFNGRPHDAFPRQRGHVAGCDVMKHEPAIPPPHPHVLFSKA